jgi:hypothetical protein
MKSLIWRLPFAGLACTTLVLAQTANLSGRIQDSSGAVVPKANVSVLDIRKGVERKAESNSSGQYVFTSLLPSVYKVSVSAPGFKTSTQENVMIDVGQNAQLDFTLQLGNVQESVTVTSGNELIQTTSPTLKNTVDSARVVELPLNGRNAADLSLLVPGVVTSGSNSGNDTDFMHPRGEKEISINGSRNNNVRYSMDGGVNMDHLWNLNLPFPFPDAVQEFSVETSNMGVELGSSSAGSINIVTKSGTNQVHGDLFWFVRNTDFDASDFFSHQQDQLKQNQAGFTLGGPILKNKLFAFGGYQRLTIRTASGASKAQTLTAQERQGDFSADGVTLLNPYAPGTVFPNNKIPTSMLSPAALALQSVSPLPGPDGFTHFTYNLPQDENQYVGRLDYVPASNHSLWFRAFENDQSSPFHTPADNIHVAQQALSVFQDSISGTLGHVWTISPSMIVHTQVSASHAKSDAMSDFPKTIADFGVNVFAASNDIDVELANSGVSYQDQHLTQLHRATQEILHDWTFVKGAHTLTWGAQFDWGQYNENTIYHSSGGYYFDGHATGLDRADFMIGLMSSFTQNNGEYENRRQFNKGFYFGDVWRATPRLTITAGVRYEPYAFFSDTMNRNQTFSPQNYASGTKSNVFVNAPPGLLYFGDTDPAGGKVSGTVTRPDNNNWAPRLGFAWDPTGSGKMSIRGGYAIFYDAPSLVSQNNSNDVTPFSYSVTLYNGAFDNPYAGNEHLNVYPLNGFSSTTPFPNPLSTIVLDNRYTSPYTQDWSLTLERKLVRDTILRVAYVGTKTTHLKSEWDENAPIYNQSLSLADNIATIDQRRSYAGYQTIDRFFHGLNASYNSLQVTLDKRYNNGFTVLASYTWSKSLDYQSQNGGAGSMITDPFNFFAYRGPADQNRTHRFVGSSVWDLPGGKLNSRFARTILGDWKLSGILTLESGRPFTIYASGNPMAGIGGISADLVGTGGNPVLDTSRSKGAKVAEYFDVTRFADPTAGTFGNLGRNILTGPGFANLDASLVKGFRVPLLGEGGLAQLRFEGFNILNRTNFGLPDTGLTSPTFGQLTATDGNARILQLAVKLVF